MKTLTWSQLKSLISTIISAMITAALCYILYLQPNLTEGAVSVLCILLGNVFLALTIINAFNFKSKLHHPDEIL